MTEHKTKNRKTVTTPLAGRLLRQMRQAMARAPGGDFVLSQARSVEDVLLEDLQLRLNGASRYQSLPSPGETASGYGQERDVSLQCRFEALSEQSLEQTPESAQARVYGRIINQLVPDEVRILTALSDGSDIAISHLVARGGRFKNSDHRVMAFLSVLAMKVVSCWPMRYRIILRIYLRLACSMADRRTIARQQNTKPSRMVRRYVLPANRCVKIPGLSRSLFAKLHTFQLSARHSGRPAPDSNLCAEIK